MTSNTNHSTIPGSILHKNRIFLKHFDWPKLKKRINKQLERNEKWIAKLNEKKATSIKNSKYIPGNATINQEYVKCGKRGGRGVSMVRTTTHIGKRMESCAKDTLENILPQYRRQPRIMIMLLAIL